MSREEIIKKVCVRKDTGSKYVTIPKKSEIEEGDHVFIEKVKRKNG